MPFRLTLSLWVWAALAAAIGAVDIGVYFESQFVSQQLLELSRHSKNLQLAKVAVHPVPHGNSKEMLKENGHYQYEHTKIEEKKRAMCTDDTQLEYVFAHGPEECYLNRVEACGVSIMNEMQIDVWVPWVDCVNRSQVDLVSLLKAEGHIVKAIAASQQALKEAERARAAAVAAAEAARHGNLGPAAAEAAAAAMASSNAAHDAAKASAEVTAAAAAAAAGGRNSWVMCGLEIPHGRMVMFEILACSLSPMGEKIQHSMAEQTPPHNYVPWVTIDRQHSTLAEKDLTCAICSSSAGKEQSLAALCAGKEGCDQQQQQQQEKEQQDPAGQQQEQQQQQKDQQPAESVQPQEGVAAASTVEVVPNPSFFHGPSQEEV
ncbi:hypothetical protein Efla_001282 [Eimeria flavescens]